MAALLREREPNSVSLIFILRACRKECDFQFSQPSYRTDEDRSNRSNAVSSISVRDHATDSDSCQHFIGCNPEECLSEKISRLGHRRQRCPQSCRPASGPGDRPGDPAGLPINERSRDNGRPARAGPRA